MRQDKPACPQGIRLRELTSALGRAAIYGEADPPIRAIVHDSREAGPGSLFVALRGAQYDGHDFIPEAITSGAAAIVREWRGERTSETTREVPTVEVPDAREALARIACRFHGDPSHDLALIGVTGTNGKTTVTTLLDSILAAAGKPAGLIGTIAIRYGGRSLPPPHTTPEAQLLQQTLAEMRARGIEAVAMEVSSHALAMKRTLGTRFAVRVFTNLSPDHLDFHEDMETYFEAKAGFFDVEPHEPGRAPLGVAVLNRDNPHGAALAKRTSLPVVTYGLEAGADVWAPRWKADLRGIEAEITTASGSIEIRSPLFGDFNLSNILAATAAALTLGIPLSAVSAGIASVRGIPGRMERIPNARGLHVFVDYAHTPDALERTLEATARFLPAGAEQGRLICVFGCGGDRDRGKRPVMGRIAAERSHLAIVTSDNPRTEDPLAIIREIEAGIRPLGIERLSPETLRPGTRGRAYLVVPDRREAIACAVETATPADLVVIAGKGHENYQIIGTQRKPFDDREETRAALERSV